MVICQQKGRTKVSGSFCRLTYMKSLAIGMFTIMFLLAGIMVAPAAAQSVCQEILANGAFRNIAQRERSFSSLVYAARLEQMSYQEAKRDFEANGGINIKGISFTAGMSEQNYSRSIERLRQSVDLAEVRSHEAQLVVADGDPAIVSAWQNCVGGLRGMVARIRPIDDTTAELIVEFRPFPGAQPPIVEPGGMVRNATVLSGDHYLQVGSSNIGVANPRALVLRRNTPEAAVYVVVNTNQGSATAYLPARPPLSPPIDPLYDMTGRYKSRGLGHVVVTQSGTRITWDYIEGPIEHNFQGQYRSPTTATGIQTRVDRRSGCTARMYLEIDAAIKNQICHVSRLEPDGAPQCGIPGNFREQFCHSLIQ